MSFTDKCTQWSNALRAVKSLTPPTSKRGQMFFSLACAMLSNAGIAVAFEPGAPDSPKTLLDETERGLVYDRKIGSWFQAIRDYKRRTGCGLTEARAEVVKFSQWIWGEDHPAF